MVSASLDEPISTYLPGFSPINDSEIGAHATVVDILCHRTGLEDQASLYCGPNGMPLFCDEITLLRTINALNINPGDFRQVWRYSPLLYALVTCLLEKASGMTFADLLATRIFRPLGMTSTSLVGFEHEADTQNDLLAKPYAATAAGEYIERNVPAEAYHFPFDASMGIQSSVIDMIHWAKVIISAYNATFRLPTQLDDTASLVLPEMKTILESKCQLPPNVGGSPAYCLGWFLHNGHFVFDDMFDDDGQTELLDWPCTLPAVKPDQPPQKILYHSGLGNGFASSVHIYPERGDAVVVLGNSSCSGDAVDCISRLVTAVICGHGLAIDDLQKNLRHYTDLETGRWQVIERELRIQQTKRVRHGLLPVDNKIIGRYKNGDRDLIINIEGKSGDTRPVTTSFEPFVGAVVKFGDLTNLGLDLWYFCDNTLCFLPSEKEYQGLGMSYMAHWAQYLLHLENFGSQPSGLWWQFDGAQDAIWFERQEDAPI